MLCTYKNHPHYYYDNIEHAHHMHALLTRGPSVMIAGRLLLLIVFCLLLLWLDGRLRLLASVGD